MDIIPEDGLEETPINNKFTELNIELEGIQLNNIPEAPVTRFNL